jgi:hypothetical protein
MSDEQLPGGGITIEAPHAERAPYENGSRVASLQQPAMMSLKTIRDQGTEFFNTVGILALAAIETADVVGRAAGRMMYQATTDGSRASFEMAHELTRTAHDVVVDTAQIAVDTVTDLGTQVIRGATVLSRQGRELSDVLSEAGQGLVRLAVTVMRQTDRHEAAKPVTAVPIIVN